MNRHDHDERRHSAPAIFRVAAFLRNKNEAVFFQRFNDPFNGYRVRH